MARAARSGIAVGILLGASACAGPEREGVFDALTYNVQGLPDALTDSARPGEERMRAIAPLLEVYPLVALQEDFDAGLHALVTDTAHPHTSWFDARVDGGRVYGAGLTLLSSWEPVEDDPVHYLDCHGVLDSASDCLASKGFQRVTVQLGGQPLDIVNTHHEAGGGELDVQAREAQVAQLLADLAERPDRAVVLLGDTNLRPSREADAAALAAYADAGLIDACEATACAEPDHIDRILVRSGEELQLEVVGWANEDVRFRFEAGDPMSDHPPIVATLGWSAGGG